MQNTGYLEEALQREIRFAQREIDKIDAVLSRGVPGHVVASMDLRWILSGDAVPSFRAVSATHIIEFLRPSQGAVEIAREWNRNSEEALHTVRPIEAAEVLLAQKRALRKEIESGFSHYNAVRADGDAPTIPT